MDSAFPLSSSLLAVPALLRCLLPRGRRRAHGPQQNFCISFSALTSGMALPIAQGYVDALALALAYMSRKQSYML